MRRMILSIMAHPDDETIGCEDSLLRHAREGDLVHAMCATNGVGSRATATPDATARRTAPAITANGIIGFEWSAMLDMLDNALDSAPLLNIVKAIETIKRAIHPGIGYTHATQDLTIDHQRIHQAVLVVFRPQPGETWTEIRCCGIPSATYWGGGPFTPAIYTSKPRQTGKPRLPHSNATQRNSVPLRAHDHTTKSMPLRRSAATKPPSRRPKRSGIRYGESPQRLRDGVRHHLQVRRLLASPARCPGYGRILQDWIARRSRHGRLFNHIRMLDTKGYPNVFIDHGRYRFRFSRPALRFGGRLEASVSIELTNEEGAKE